MQPTNDKQRYCYVANCNHPEIHLFSFVQAYCHNNKCFENQSPSWPLQKKQLHNFSRKASQIQCCEDMFCLRKVANGAGKYSGASVDWFHKKGFTTMRQLDPNLSAIPQVFLFLLNALWLLYFYSATWFFFDRWFFNKNINELYVGRCKRLLRWIERSLWCSKIWQVFTATLEKYKNYLTFDCCISTTLK